jgi:hypothetical protein
MKIKELDQHCGDCSLIEYCGNSYGYSICCDERFEDMEESDYKRIAETATDIKPFKACKGCERPDCGVYRYSDDNFANEPCEHDEESRNYYCEQIANHVEKALGGAEG